MEVVRPNLDGIICKGYKAHGFHMDDVVLILQWPFDQQEAAAGDGDHIPLIKVWRDDDVGDAGLVFHGEEDEAFRCSGALTGDDAACCADPLAIAAAAEICGGEDFLSAELFAAVGHGMAAGGEGSCAGEERAFGLAGALDLPEGIAAMADASDGIKGSDVGEEGDFFFVDGGDAECEVVDGGEGAVGFARGNDGFSDLLAEAAGVAEAEAEGEISVQRTAFSVQKCRLRVVLRG